MVIGVVPDVRIIFRASTDDDALGTAVVQAGGVHGEASVVAVALIREYAFVVAEVSTVLARVGIGPAGEDVVYDGLCFGRQDIHRAALQPRDPNGVSLIHRQR